MRGEYQEKTGQSMIHSSFNSNLLMDILQVIQLNKIQIWFVQPINTVKELLRKHEP